MGLVKMSRQIGHVREDLRSSISFLKAETLRASEDGEEDDKDCERVDV